MGCENNAILATLLLFYFRAKEHGAQTIQEDPFIYKEQDMKQKFLLAAMIAVFAIGFGVSAAQAADQGAQQQQTWAELDAQMRPLMDQMYQKRSELAGMYNSGNVDQARLQALFGEIADLQAQMFQIQQNSGYAAGGPGYGMGGGRGWGGRGGMRGGYGMGGGYGMRGGMGGGCFGGGMGGGFGGGHCW
jgi:hypothetical protein